MRGRLLIGFAAVLMACPLVLSAQQQEDSVAEAARKAREKKKAAAQAKKTFTNDDLGEGKSTIGATQSTGATQGSGGEGAETKVAGEKEWRARFADARAKLAEAEKELSILQRELNQNQVQYYPDPQKTLQQETFRSDINDKRKKLADKEREVASLRQGIEDLERELRAAGAPPGWARP